jgi:cytochrome c biogenesis protein ResB
MRLTRYYYPFSLTLLKATHDKYKGTEIPKNFSSRVRINNPGTGEARETVIYMNNPLRYGGQTFYQYQMSAGEMAQRQGMTPSSTFQVGAIPVGSHLMFPPC